MGHNRDIETGWGHWGHGAMLGTQGRGGHNRDMEVTWGPGGHDGDARETKGYSDLWDTRTC